MQILKSLDVNIEKPTAISVGYFDGVHKGHKGVIDAALAQQKNGLLSCVFSFEMTVNSPQNKKGAKLIQSPSLKEKAIKDLGVDIFLCPTFSSFMSLTPKEYAVDLLYKKLNARVVCCGYDYRFGKGAVAGANDLKELLTPYGVQVIQLPAVEDLGLPISSTRIRKALEDGDIPTANRLLGREFAVDFVVSHGKKLGSKLGFPTANQIIDQRFIAPRFGVYATTVIVDGISYPAVSNVGVKPTVGSDVVGAESYIIGFEGDLYGKSITTQFKAFIRDEQKFPSIELLRTAIAKDTQTAITLHNI